MGSDESIASDYNREDLELVKTVCLTIATILGDEVMQKHVVLVGGLVPSLLCNAAALPEGADTHVGTSDVDVTFSLAILDEQLYRTISETLRSAGFKQDVNENGRPTPHRWKHSKLEKIVVDFLMPQVTGEKGRSMWLEKDFAPMMGKAVHLVFDPPPIAIELEGMTLEAANVKRKLRVCTPGAFIVLKAIAHRGRPKAKDAYDLWYMAANYGEGPAAVAQTLKPLLGDAVAQEAVRILREDFAAVNQLGPVRVAKFLARTDDAVLLEQVVKTVALLLKHVGGS